MRGLCVTAKSAAPFPEWAKDGGPEDADEWSFTAAKKELLDNLVGALLKE
jgi:hypothetical protein